MRGPHVRFCERRGGVILRAYSTRDSPKGSPGPPAARRGTEKTVAAGRHEDLRRVQRGAVRGGEGRGGGCRRLSRCQLPMQILGVPGGTPKRSLWVVMNPGSHAFATAMVEIPPGRSSFTNRSCSVPNACSTRPFAWGLFAQVMSMFSSDSTRPNCVINDRRQIASLPVHPEDAVLVAIKGHRLAVRFQIITRRAEVIERQFRGNEPTPVVARLTTAPRQQARGAIPPETAQQPEDLMPTKAYQRAGVSDAQTTGLNP